MPLHRPLDQSSKLKNVLYEIRGSALDEVVRLEAEGHTILRLNTGNPAAFGFEARTRSSATSSPPSPTRTGTPTPAASCPPVARWCTRYETEPGFPQIDVDDVYLGNGVSELITMVMQALLDEGDEVLIPSPDYPLWTAMTSLSDGVPVHYRCDEPNGWEPDLEHIRSLVTPRTKAIVVINPNNPTGAVYSREVLEGIADDRPRAQPAACSPTRSTTASCSTARVHIPMASVAPDLLCLTFNGLSKTYRVAGYRSGWLVVTGPASTRPASSRASPCSRPPACARTSPRSTRSRRPSAGVQSIDALIAPGGRLHEQRDVAYRG